MHRPDSFEESNIELSCAAYQLDPAWNSKLHAPIKVTFKATTAAICYVALDFAELFLTEDLYVLIVEHFNSLCFKIWLESGNYVI